MKLQTVAWANSTIVLIDQTKLPHRLTYMRCRTVKQLWWAIRNLKVRGAPAIGAAAALGMVLGLGKNPPADFSAFKKKADKISRYLTSSRPTAINLFWALTRIQKVIAVNKKKPAKYIREQVLKEALAIIKEDQLTCRKMADNAQSLIKDNDRILTYCNAGILATIDYGTALGAVYRARELKKNIKVYACETRPLLQGARLTCWELDKKHIDVTLICDNMAGYLMQQKKIDKVFVGADRIAANGDAANKIGSYSIAVLANFHKIPFYVVAPYSSFDFTLLNGSQIPIEERNGNELKKKWFKHQIAPAAIKTYNPAFDLIPYNLISAIITEKALVRPPYFKNLKKIRKPSD